VNCVPRMFWRAGLVAVLGALLSTQTAQAGLVLSIKVGSGSTIDVSSYLQSSGNNTYNFGGFGGYLVFNVNGTLASGTNPVTDVSNLTNGKVAIRVTVTDNAPGDTVAQLFNVTNDVRTGGGGAPQNVVITATETGFTSPTGLVTLSGAFPGPTTIGNSQLNFVSKVLQGSTTLATVQNTGTSGPFNVSGQYTLQNITTITNLNANEEFSTSGNTEVRGVHHAPAPATAVLALLALPALGLFARRKARATQD
jgi:hypothetical protein